MESLFESKKIGIVGYGHLGSAIIDCLIKAGLPTNQLYISESRSQNTADRIKTAGLELRCYSLVDIFDKCDIIILTIRPQDFASLLGYRARGASLILSFIPGVSIETLRTEFSENACHVCCSNPESLRQGKAIAGVLPYNDVVAKLLNALDVRIVHIESEEDASIFIASTCYVGALFISKNEEKNEQAIEALEKESHIYRELYEWAKDIIPRDMTPMQTDSYITKMATKGGITEAIIDCLREGSPLDVAMRRGVQRCDELALEIQEKIIT